MQTRKHYDNAVYWQLPNDGANFKCTDCGKRLPHNKVILTQIPDGDNRQTICLDCVDEWWLEHATNLGMYPD